MALYYSAAGCQLRFMTTTNNSVATAVTMLTGTFPSINSKARETRNVTATIAAELGEVAQGDPHWRVLFLLGVMLFAVTFVLNLLGDLFIQRLQKRLTAS